MPIHRYSVLHGSVADTQQGRGGDKHYQIRVRAQDTDYRVAINVQSDQKPCEVLYYADQDYRHPVLERLHELQPGLQPLESKPGGMALDYVRGNLFDVQKMRPLGRDVAGPDNDLNEIIQSAVEHAREAGGSVYAVGAVWGPEPDKPDRYFGFRPGNGIHDIHMNQGSAGRHAGDNGVWQDGGLFIHMHASDRWIAVFLAFQSQKFHSDDHVGDVLFAPLDAVAPALLGLRILAATPGPGRAGGGTVLLFNAGERPAKLGGCVILDEMDRAYRLRASVLGPGQARAVRLDGKTAKLVRGGGLLTLVDPQGLKIHGVAYTRAQVGRAGSSIVF